MPWVAMGFTTLYLQLLGFSDIKAAILVALFSLGCAIGSFGGGYIGAGPSLSGEAQPSATALTIGHMADTSKMGRSSILLNFLILFYQYLMGL